MRKAAAKVLLLSDKTKEIVKKTLAVANFSFITLRFSLFIRTFAPQKNSRAPVVQWIE